MSNKRKPQKTITVNGKRMNAKQFAAHRKAIRGIRLPGPEVNQVHDKPPYEWD